MPRCLPPTKLAVRLPRRTAAVTYRHDGAGDPHLRASLKSGQLDQRDRATLVPTVQQQTGLPQAEAEKRVDDAYTELEGRRAEGPRCGGKGRARRR